MEAATAQDGALALYREATRGDPASFAAVAFAWLHRHLPFDAGSLVTSFADRPAYLDAHFTGFADLPALMESWQRVAHLDVLSPRLLAPPGQARRQDIDDPLVAGEAQAPLRAHLRRFRLLHSLCIALQLPESEHLVVIILVRSQPGTRASEAELAWLTQHGPLLAEAYAACRAIALLRNPTLGSETLRVARVDAQGAFVQTTPAFAHAMWGGRAPQDVHLDPRARQALARGRSWPLPGRGLTLHASPDGKGWLLTLRGSAGIDLLSAREREVARRFARGETHRDIAAALSLSPATVRNHLSKIYDKLQVRHRAGLISALA